MAIKKTASVKTAKPAVTKKTAPKAEFVSPWKENEAVRTSGITLSYVDEKGKHHHFNICTIHWGEVDDLTAVRLANATNEMFEKYFRELAAAKPASDKKKKR